MNLRNIKKLILITLLTVSSGCNSKKYDQSQGKADFPNVIIFYVDDLGYGDLSCYGAKGVNTPNIDNLAKDGVMFTDAHTSSSTCTPSRYSLLTGNHAFRRNAAILPGDAPLLIDTTHQTLASMLKEAGYKTAVVGKWHLGLGKGGIDWNEKISPGPNEIGFDYSFLIPATGDRVPTVFVENGSVVNWNPEDDSIRVSYKKRIDPRPIGSEIPDQVRQKPDGQHGKTIVNGVSRIGYMTGGESALWKDEEFPYLLNKQSKDFIESSEDVPFFLFYSFHDIHVPRLPHSDFQGKSTMGPRGDAIVQVDWAVGDIISYLESKELMDNTLIIFTSDNGPVLYDGYQDQSVELLGDHRPGGAFRGGKYSAYEAGTRVPMISYWKGHTTNITSSALMSQIDILGSLATLTNQKVGESVVDSENYLETLMGQSRDGRDILMEEAFTFAIRKGNWKYIRPVEGNKQGWIKGKGIESALSNEPQLFELTEDPGETKNLAAEKPELVTELDKIMQSIIDLEE